MSPPTRAGVFTSGGSTSAETLVRDAQIVLANCGHPMGASKVRRLVQTFQARVERNGWAFFDFLANAVQLDSAARRRALQNPEIARVIGYADPTGEMAVANVLRGR